MTDLEHPRARKASLSSETLRLSLDICRQLRGNTECWFAVSFAMRCRRSRRVDYSTGRPFSPAWAIVHIGNSGTSDEEETKTRVRFDRDQSHVKLPVYCHPSSTDGHRRMNQQRASAHTFESRSILFFKFLDLGTSKCIYLQTVSGDPSLLVVHAKKRPAH